MELGEDGMVWNSIELWGWNKVYKSTRVELGVESRKEGDPVAGERG